MRTSFLNLFGQERIQNRAVPLQQTEEIHLDQAPEAFFHFIPSGVFLYSALQSAGMIVEIAFFYSSLDGKAPEGTVRTSGGGVGVRFWRLRCVR
jgi:hypothetical protein